MPGKAPSHPGGWPLNFKCGHPGRQILPRLDEVSAVEGIAMIEMGIVYELILPNRRKQYTILILYDEQAISNTLSHV